MSCNCHNMKTRGTLDHVRIIAQQMANVEKKEYVIYKCESVYNFVEAKFNTFDIVEIIKPIIYVEPIESENLEPIEAPIVKKTKNKSSLQ